MTKHGLGIAIVVGAIGTLGVLGYWGWYEYTKVCCALPDPDEEIVFLPSFDACAELYPVMESYPRQCNTPDGQHFVENIGNELEKTDLIRIELPRPNTTVQSPLEIKGEARGTWFFEASFPVVLTDWDGKIIANGIATAGDGSVSSTSDWMTEDFVPFTASLEFALPVYSNRGSLILQKDNPSGLPEHDDALEVPVLFDVSE